MPITLHPISRRRFLAGTLTGVSATWFSNVLGAEPASSEDVWAILSDTHIPGDRNKTGGKPPIKPVEHLKDVRTDILSGEIGKPGGVIVSGDCVYIHGLPDDYTTLLEEFEPFRQAGLPVHFVMGNHDNRSAFLVAVAKAEKKDLKSVPDRLHSIVETPKANFFLLDSLEATNKTPGRFGDEQLQWLADELDSRKDKPAILVAHHDPDFSSGIAKNSHALQDTSAFFDVIEKRKQVKAYFYGHTHTWRQLRREDIHMVNFPAVAWRFDQSQPFAWTLLTLKDNGISLKLRSLEPEHPKHNEVIELAWR